VRVLLSVFKDSEGHHTNLTEHSSYILVFLASCGWFLYVRLPSIGYIAVPMYCISFSYLQLGISDHPQLGMECHSRAPPTPVDDMGLLSFSLSVL
jgi:hypothetical protein